MAISRKHASDPAQRRRPVLRAVGVDGDDSHESTVAIELAQTRLALGIDLADVTDELHIREEHLEAIEAGRFDQLPGPTYTIGFLRSYAEFLGLDALRLVERFRVESAGFAAQRKLNFPSPADDSRMPTVPVLVFALALAGAVGFGWYTVSGVERVAKDGVPEVPAHLVAPPPTPTPVEAAAAPPPETAAEIALPDLQIPAPAPAEPAVTAETPAGTPAETDAAVDVADIETAVGADAPVVPVDDRPAATPVVEPAAAPVAEPVAVVAAAEPAVAPAPEASVEAVTPSTPAETSAVAPAETVVATAPAEVPAPVVAAGAYVPRVYGRANSDARVRLRAIEECWIQVTGPDNELLLTRILKPGDVYLVPNRPGMVMMTGNAGGVEIALDGEALPPIGPVGAVRRNIALDPDALLARKASLQ